jgi:hypothetical protein
MGAAEGVDESVARECPQFAFGLAGRGGVADHSGAQQRAIPVIGYLVGWLWMRQVPTLMARSRMTRFAKISKVLWTRQINAR